MNPLTFGRHVTYLFQTRHDVLFADTQFRVATINISQQHFGELPIEELVDRLNGLALAFTEDSTGEYLLTG